MHQIYLILIHLFIYLFSNSKTITNFKLNDIIGITVDPRPQDDILQKNVTVIFRYEEVCPALDCKFIYVIKKTAYSLKMNMLPPLA